MRRKDAEREAARQLRAEGLSINAVAATLGVAKSSVSVWVRGVVPGPWLIRPAGALRARRLPVWSSGRARRCSRCELTLPLEFFNRLRDGHQWWCRECFRAYFRERGDVHRGQSGAAKRARVARAKAHVIEILRATPCKDCGEPDIVVLEFDHVEPKRSGLAKLVADGASPGVLDQEITNCEIVCVNCHRRRTARRARWLRADPDWRARLSASGTRPHENVAIALDVLAESGCVDCGERDLCTLEFDHVGTKRAAVMRMAWNAWGLRELKREIDECEVRCGNCHRRRTAARAGHYRHLASILDPRL